MAVSNFSLYSLLGTQSS